jgi:hypothetical protein
MKFQLEDRIYDGTSIEDLSLRAMLDLERETESFGRKLRMPDIEAMAESLAECATDKDRSRHPDVLWLTAVTIWAARRAAGETLSFADAIDFPMSHLTFLPEPQDHKEKAKANPTKPRGSAADGRDREGLRVALATT